MKNNAIKLAHFSKIEDFFPFCQKRPNIFSIMLEMCLKIHLCTKLELNKFNLQI